MDKIIKLLLTVFLVLVTLLVFSIWGIFRNFVFLDFDLYPKNAEHLDLTEKEISLEYYQKLQEILPGCQIKWNVPIQGQLFHSDSETIKVTNITDSEIALLTYMPNLTVLDASGCRNYPQLKKLQATYPDLQVIYTVLIDGIVYSWDTREITVSHLTAEEVNLLQYLPLLTTVDATTCIDYPQLSALYNCRPDVEILIEIQIGENKYNQNTTEIKLTDPDISELQTKLACLPNLESVYLVEPSADAAELMELRKAYPSVAINWEKSFFDKKTYTSTSSEVDLSGMSITIEDATAYMEYFPDAQKLIMSDCGIDNETMALFREKMRAEYKVVWTVTVTGARVRTDETVFHSSGRGISLINEQSYDLFYCEDMIVVDIGHSMVKEIDWVRGMPNLKYLILADNWIRDISAISTCKNLIYLELFINKYLYDISPLVGCTALQDLSVADCRNIDVAPLAEMPWLKNLWVNNCDLTTSERELLRTSLPDTHIEFDHGFTTGGGWRQLQNYFDMRDIMGLSANVW